MQIEILTLCDNVQVYAGKAVVIGAYNQVVTKQLPVSLNLTLAIRIVFELNELGDKKFIFNIINPDGTPLTQEFSIDAKQGPVDENILLNTLDLNLNLGFLEIKQHGLYTIKMNFDNKEYCLKFAVSHKP